MPQPDQPLAGDGVPQAIPRYRLCNLHQTETMLHIYPPASAVPSVLPDAADVAPITVCETGDDQELLQEVSSLLASVSVENL